MKYRLIYQQWTFFRNGSDLVNTLFCIYLSFHLQNSKHFPTQGLLVPRPVLPACRVVRQKVTGCGTGVGRGLGLPACGPGVSPQTVLVHCGGKGRFPLIFPICAFSLRTCIPTLGCLGHSLSPPPPEAGPLRCLCWEVHGRVPWGRPLVPTGSSAPPVSSLLWQGCDACPLWGHDLDLYSFSSS